MEKFDLDGIDLRRFEKEKWFDFNFVFGIIEIDVPVKYLEQIIELRKNENYIQ